MFGTIRKHQTWLWAVIITVIVVSFVVYFSPYSKMHNEGGRAEYGSINGERVTELQYAAAQREVVLRFFVMTGRWPDEDSRRSGFDPMRETYQWLLLTQKVRQLGIQASDEAAAQQARQMVRPFEQMGITSPVDFINRILKPRGIQAQDFERFVKHFLGLQELISVVGLSGKLVTPAEARSLYEREHQEMAAEAVFFDATNFLASVTVTPEALGQFYSNRLSAYRIPDRVQVSYVKFGVSNHLAEAESALKTNLTEIVEENFKRLGTNYFRDAKTPEESKARIREELIRTRALSEARKAAAAFAGPIFDKEKMKAQDLEQQAKAEKLNLEVSKPFSRDGAPEGLDVGPEFAKAAFALTDEEPISRPVLGTDGVYIMAVSKRLPSEVPTLDQIRAQVTTDYRQTQAINLARTAGANFQTTLTNALAQGKSFAAACLEAKLKPVMLPPFSLSTRSLPEAEEHLPLNQLKQLAFSTTPGKVSPFQPTQEGGAIIFVKEKLPLDQAKMQTDLPAFVSFVRRTRQEEAFNDWFRKEAEKGLRNTPLARPQPSTLGTAAPAKS